MMEFMSEVYALGCFANLLWIICGGLWQALAWGIAGILWCVTIIGIPIGRQCFKIASLSFAPFGKEVEYGGGAPSFIANVIWIIVSGIPLAICAAINGLVLFCTIIGIPFGLQCFKIAKLALMPFGARIG